MRRAIAAWVLTATVLAGGISTAAEKSALEADPSGWIDLMPGKDLQGWKRVLLPGDEKYNPEKKNPWRVDPKTKTLICEGVGIKEMLLYQKPFGDGIYHVEWRFRKTDDKVGYNGGIYFRCAPDGKVWLQAQVAHLEKPPQVVDIFGEVPRAGQSERVLVTGKGEQLVLPPGQWNTCEITLKGKDVTIRLNGEVATTWKDCPVEKGLVGLQAEFYDLEFRNLKFKELK